MELDHIHIRGAREHNLRSIDVRIPKKKLVVLSGVSGSGKSSTRLVRSMVDRPMNRARATGRL